MKWIGQHIYDLISRFRNDVYLEDISTGTIASGGNLGLDSNNKIVKATESSGDIEGVTAGTGLSGGGTTGTVTLNVSGLTVSEIAAGSILVAGETFADNDTSLMSAAAINDRIESFGYTTNTGDITGVDLTGAGPMVISSETGTTSGDYSATIGIASASATVIGAVELATTAETTTGTDTTRAVTPDGLKDGYQGSTNVVTVGTISTGEWRGTAINAAYLNGQSGTNTGDETLASINALDITEVGTIDSGVWNGTAIASAYLDADTAHLSTSIYVETCNFSDNLGTTEHFIPFVTASENTAFSNVVVPWIAPVAGKLLKVHWRSSQHCNISSNEMSFRLYKISDGTRWSGTNESLLGTKVVTGPARTSHAIADFTSGLESGAGSETNAFAANDLLGVSIQHSQDQGVSEKVTVTLVFELDFSSY